MDRRICPATRTSRDQHSSRGPFVLMAAITATELVMLNVIFWARAQGTSTGLVLAVAWPWLAAGLLPLLWSIRGQRMFDRPALALGSRTRIAAGLGFALAVAVLLGRLVSVA